MTDAVMDYLEELERMKELREANAKPAPALPLEVWHVQEFDPEKAHAATLALCKGQ